MADGLMLDRLLERRQISPGPLPTDCWVWLGSKNRKGYGWIFDPVKKKPRQVHRVAHEVFLGPIPEGYEVDHACRVRPCFNPEHIEAVTQEVNRARARRTYCPRGHAYDEANTHWMMSRQGRLVPMCRTCHKDRERVRRNRERIANEVAEFEKWQADQMPVGTFWHNWHGTEEIDIVTS
jgi:Zn-finger protein